MKVKVKAVSRKNRGYVGILTDTKEYGERWMNAKDDSSTKHIKKGITLNVDVVENGEYLNFTVSPHGDIEEGIFERHKERQEGQSLGNAKTNAVNIVIAAYKKDDIKKDQIKAAIKEFTTFLLSIGG